MRFMIFGPRLFSGLLRFGVSFPLRMPRTASVGRSDYAGGEFVYVIRNNLGHVKIGRSINPSDRILTLQTGSAVPLALVASVWAGESAWDIEQQAHSYLANSKMEGEWFATSPEIAQAAIYSAAARLGVRLGEYPEAAEPPSIERAGLAWLITAAIILLAGALMSPLPTYANRLLLGAVVLCFLYRRWGGLSRRP